MADQQQFKLESLPGYEFRVGKVSPIDLLAISTQIDFENFKMTKTLMTFCVENAEVKMGEKWVPVKVRDREVYKPAEIATNFLALNELFMWMMDNVVTAVFPRSSE